MKRQRVFIFPGSDGRNRKDYWYQNLKSKLISLDFDVKICSTHGESDLEKRSKIIEAKYGSADIIIGHSLGAVSGMKYCERNKLSKLFLVDPSTKEIFIESLKKQKNARYEKLLNAWGWKILYNRIVKNTGRIYLIHDNKMGKALADIIKGYHDYYCNYFAIKPIKMDAKKLHFTSKNEEGLFEIIINKIHNG